MNKTNRMVIKTLVRGEILTAKFTLLYFYSEVIYLVFTIDFFMLSCSHYLCGSNAFNFVSNGSILTE